MDAPWTRERVVSPALARALIQAQLPCLSPSVMVPLGAGSDNSAFLVNDAFVFRFPRRQLAVELLETEVRVLPALAPALPLAIPVPRLVGSPGSDVPLAFAGDSFLPGRTAIEEDDGRLARFRPPFTPSRSRFTQTPKGTRRSGERR